MMPMDHNTWDSFVGATKRAYTEPPPAEPPREPERMDKWKWRQTALDLPIVAAGGALGYGIARTIADKLVEGAASSGRKIPRSVSQHLPMAVSAITAMGGYAAGRVRNELYSRRQEASRKGKEDEERRKQSGVEPAPQSRKVPQKKYSDPWRYDPRGTGWT